jgi:hypothetical protein
VTEERQALCKTVSRSLVAFVLAFPCAAVAQDHPGGLLGPSTPWWPSIRSDCPPAFSGTSLTGTPLSHEERFDQLETCAIDLLSDDPIHPIAEAVAARGGFGGGLSGGWDFSHNVDQIDFSWRALATVNGFWAVSALYTIAPRIRRGGPSRTIARPRFDIYAKIWDLPSLAFYGLGPGAPHVAIPFGFQELITGADASFPLFDWVQLGGRVEFRRPEYDAPAIAPATPGLAQSAFFVRYSAVAHLHTPLIPPYAAFATLDYSIYQDLGGGPYSFGQFTARVLWTHPFTGDLHVLDPLFCHVAKVTSCDYGTLTLKGQVTLSNTFGHSVVPFYYMPTLGGTDLDGFDTLRGFDDYRFRAPDDWLAQVEYGHKLFGPVSLLLFYDAGKVALGSPQLNFAQVRQDFGFGATVAMLARTVLRAYIAFGSGESTQTAVKLAQF